MEWVKGVQWLRLVCRNWICIHEKWNQCASQKIRGPADRKETQNTNQSIFHFSIVIGEAVLGQLGCE